MEERERLILDQLLFTFAPNRKYHNNTHLPTQMNEGPNAFPKISSQLSVDPKENR